MGLVDIRKKSEDVTIRFSIIVTPKYYPPVTYYICVRRTGIASGKFLFDCKKQVPHRRILDFIYDIFTKPDYLEVRKNPFDTVRGFLERIRKFEDKRFDEEILAGLGECLVTGRRKIIEDYDLRFIQEHLSGRCTVV